MKRTRRSMSRLLACFAIPLVGGLLATPVTAAQGDRGAEPRTRSQARGSTGSMMVDPAVQPAGGGCRECGPTGCRHCQKHHHGCRDGVCVAACPVRPGTFGYYGTQWRRWPGEGVVPVSGTKANMPVQPPKSAVPSVDEESFGPGPDELPEPDAAATEPDGRMPLAPEPDAGPGESPVNEAEPATEPPSAPASETPEPPAADKPATKPSDSNLFDDSAARKVRRKIPIQTSTASGAPVAGGRNAVIVAGHSAELRPSPGSVQVRSVPRVAFQPTHKATRSGTSRSNQPR